MRDEIRDKYGSIPNAKGQEVYDDYMLWIGLYIAGLQHVKRAVLKDVQKEYDAKAAVKDIQEQLPGSAEFLKHAILCIGGRFKGASSLGVLDSVYRYVIRLWKHYLYKRVEAY